MQNPNQAEAEVVPKVRHCVACYDTVFQLLRQPRPQPEIGKIII
jgi:hypothetical protein